MPDPAAMPPGEFAGHPAGEPAGHPELPAWLEPLRRGALDITADELTRFVPPEGAQTRRGAVLILFGEGPGGPDLLLTERAHDMRSHPGQVSFPGGSIDPTDHSPEFTALREAEEETGLGDLRPWPGPEPAIAFVEIVPVPAARGEAEHEHADVSYVLATDRPDAIAAEHDDAELRWLPFAEARTMVNFHVRALLDRVERLL